MRLLFALAALLLPCLAAAAAPRVDTVADAGAGVVIRGEWPDACTPQVLTWGAAEGGVDVLLGHAGTACAAGQHPFAVTVPLSSSFSPAPPAAAVRALRIFAARDDAPPLLVGLRLLGGAQASAPGSGFWWPVNGASGNAVSLEVQGDQLGVALLSHDASGAPEWFFGTGQLVGSIAHVELSRVRGASPFGRAVAAPLAQPALQADIAFASSTQAKLWLSRQATGGRGIEVDVSVLQRRRFDALPESQAWLGRWLLAGGAGLPRELDFTASRSDTRGTLHLASGVGGYTLDCRTVPSGSDPLAQTCALLDAAGGIVARFDHVGIDRLDGRDRDGGAVVLLRPRSD